jgi:hypothetical protein
MLVLSSTVAMRCYNCCTDDNTSSGNYGYLPYTKTHITVMKYPGIKGRKVKSRKRRI